MKIYDLDLKVETEGHWTDYYGKKTYYVIEAKIHPMHLVRGRGDTPGEAFEDFFENVVSFRPVDPPNRDREIL
jgi:hypothetical protein